MGCSDAGEVTIYIHVVKVESVNTIMYGKSDIIMPAASTTLRVCRLKLDGIEVREFAAMASCGK